MLPNRDASQRERFRRSNWMCKARCFLLSIAALASPLGAQSDVVMQAMRDEMARSMKQLTVESLEKPYFMSYRVVESENTSVGATFGALDHSTHNKSRRLTVEVRVGDYKLDSSHVFSFNVDMGTRLRIFNGTTSLPLEDDYKEIRREIWIATDATYKKAVEDLSKKRGLLQSQNRDDDSNDFSKEDPAVSTYELPAPNVNVQEWEREARSLSLVLRQAPEIYTSNVLINCFNTYTRYLTSEGTSYTRREPSITFTANASTQAADGMPLDDFVFVQARSVAEMPSEQELTLRLRTLTDNLVKLRQANTLASYSGPVLVEGDAAPQLVRFIFISDLLAVKRTISGMPGIQQNPQAANQGDNPFLDRIGARVLPDFLNLTDDPTLTQYQGHRMTGYSKFDEDGIPSRPVKLVESGILKTLLASRDPVRGIDHSTGSRHVGQAAPTNVIMTVSTGLRNADLHAKFLELVKQRNRPFGIAVRRMARNVNNGLLAYKVFPDGHEELIRGIQFFGLTAMSFKDIVGASSEPNFLNVRFQPQRRQFDGPNESEENFSPVSLVVPSLLFEDATMRQIRAPSPKAPFSAPPFGEK